MKKGFEDRNRVGSVPWAGCSERIGKHEPNIMYVISSKMRSYIYIYTCEWKLVRAAPAGEFFLRERDGSGTG